MRVRKPSKLWGIWRIGIFFFSIKKLVIFSKKISFQISQVVEKIFRNGWFFFHIYSRFFWRLDLRVPRFFFFFEKSTFFDSFRKGFWRIKKFLRTNMSRSIFQKPRIRSKGCTKNGVKKKKSWPQLFPGIFYSQNFCHFFFFFFYGLDRILRS